MRAQMALTLVLLALIPFAGTAAAQSDPIAAQAPQHTQENFAPSAKPLPVLPATQIAILPGQIGSANEPTNPLKTLETWRKLEDREEGSGMLKFGGSSDAPNCAHIRILQAPEMDSEMVVQASPGDGGPIQTVRGLPPCRRDFSAPMTAQRFHGMPPMLPLPPRKQFAPSPASQIPSAQPWSVQPKMAPPSPKP